MINHEMVRLAKQVNLINFLSDKYPDEITKDRKNGIYRSSAHDSLVINKHAWYRFSTGKGGDTIEYLVAIQHKPFQESVKELADYNTDDEIKNFPVRKKRVRKPQKSINEFTNITKYLTSRGIPEDTIQDLIEAEKLYEDNEGNAIFCNCEQGREIYVIKGTCKYARLNKIITRESNSYWYFQVGNAPDTIYICESPIDAISLYECNKRKPGLYVSMNGLKPKIVDRVQNELNNDNLLKIKIAVDWDKAGLDFYTNNNFSKKYPFVGAGKYKSETKDWNEVLCLLSKKKAMQNKNNA